MKHYVGLVILVVLLAACDGTVHAPEKSETMIEWADFININDREYSVLDDVAIADDSFIGEEAGKVTFHVAANVNDSNYKTKEGDAAFHEKGTVIYSVEDRNDLIAVEDEESVNGYRIYQSEDADKEEDDSQIEKTDIKKVAIQKGEVLPEVTAEWVEASDIQALLTVLEKGTKREEDEVPQEEPEVYHFVFYNGEPVVAAYDLFYEAGKWYWNPNEEELLPDEVETFMEN